MSTILVVEDNAIVREPIAEALRGNGYDVVCAADGAQALSRMREGRPDLVLLDVNMPELDGFAVLGTMRRNPELKDIPVIMLTERAERENIIAAAERRVQGYLLKSQFSIDELFERVAACLGGEPVTAASVVTEESSAQDGYAQWRARAEQASDESPVATRTVTRSRPKNKTVSNEQSAPLPAAVASSMTNVESLEDLAPAITKAELFKLVNEGLELRPLGPIVQNVISVTSNAGCSADDVAKAVKNDQALSIRILKLANSSAYSRGRPVSGVKEAIQRIGIKEVRSMVMTLGVLQRYEGGAGKHVDARLFWEHSIACGLIASAVAKQRQPGKVDDSFLWGMVHDVGRLILLDHVSDQYGCVWDFAEQLALPLEAVEPKVVLVDHCEILEKALEHWQFPRDFTAAVVNHHQSVGNLKRLGPEHFDAAANVALANRLAHALLLGSSGNDVLYPIDDLVEALQLKPSMISGLTETIRDETRDLKFTMLARTGDDDWPDFALQVKERLATEVRPLCISAEPDVDVYRMFCEQITSGSDDMPPGLGVVYLRDADEFSQLTAKFDAAEEPEAAEDTPVVLIVAKGKIDANDPWLASRRYAMLTPPIRIDNFVGAMQQVLG